MKSAKNKSMSHLNPHAKPSQSQVAKALAPKTACYETPEKIEHTLGYNVPIEARHHEAAKAFFDKNPQSLLRFVNRQRQEFQMARCIANSEALQKKLSGEMG